MERFEGPDAVRRAARAVADADCPVLSPGGAATVLRVTRQFIHELFRSGKHPIRSWVAVEDGRVSFAYLSHMDVVKYGIRVGRIKSYADCCEFFFTQEMFDRCVREVQAEG